MHEIFISYRRIDTRPWAIHLYEDLCRAFGDGSVFMDTSREHGIAWGADFTQVLEHALDHCQVLVALIGPKWVTCTRQDGRRRLHVAGDWVRTEIATALRRGVLVLPVLFEGAPAPGEADLPDDLVQLRFPSRNALAIAEDNWRADVARLVARAAELPALDALHARATRPTGLRGLQELIHERADVADAVALAKHLFADTALDMRRLRLLKDIHDALHTIEKLVLDPLCAAGVAMLPRVSGTFRDSRADIEDLLRGADERLQLQRLLTVSLPLQLAAAGDALQHAAEPGRDPDLHGAVGELQRLISTMPAALETMIEAATARIRLGEQTRFLQQVRAALSPQVAADTEVRPLVQAIDQLSALGEELHWRVAEHGVLQGLDVTLRRFRDGQRPLPASDAASLEDARRTWDEAKRTRQDLAPPHSPELLRHLEAMREIEAGIDAAIRNGDAADAGERIAAYLQEVGDAFYQVDRRVKRFFAELAQTTQPIRTILDMCSGARTDD